MPPEFQPVTQLATPASDITFPAFQNYEAIFARSGNDTIYSDAPDGIITQKENVDFLFGDVFDNTVDEYVAVVFGFQAGDPLGVLNRTQQQLQIGADRFVLGDGYTPYYLNSGSPNDLLSSTNFLGLNEYAVIFDFDPLPGDKQDTIQLNGSRKDYLLVEVNGLQVPGVQRPFFGEAIFSRVLNLHGVLTLTARAMSTLQDGLQVNWGQKIQRVDPGITISGSPNLALMGLRCGLNSLALKVLQVMMAPTYLT